MMIIKSILRKKHKHKYKNEHKITTFDGSVESATKDLRLIQKILRNQ